MPSIFPLLGLLACIAAPPPGSESGTADGGGTDGGTDGGGTDSGSTDDAWLDDDIGSLVTVTWQQAQPATVQVQWRVDGGDWQSTPARAVKAGPVEQLLLGIPYDTAFEWRVRAQLDDGSVLDGDSAAFATGPLPRDFLQAELLVSEDGQDPDARWFFLSLKNPDKPFHDWAVIVDRSGAVVWALETPAGFATVHPRLSLDGTLLHIDHNSQWATFDLGKASEVWQVSIDGRVLGVIDTPGMRHPYTLLPDGALVYPATDGPEEEVLTRVDPDGSRTPIWSCRDWIQDQDLVGQCGSNSLTWHAETDRFLYSLYTMETVVEVDHATGRALRWFGRALGAWNFAPVEAAFWWQHGPHYTDQGTLLMSARITPDEDETVVREYTLNETQQTLVEHASYGIGDGVYGEVMGEAHRLGNGNTLHNTGSTPRLREFAPDGSLVWELSWDAGYVGRSTPLSDLYALQ